MTPSHDLPGRPSRATSHTSDTHTLPHCRWTTHLYLYLHHLVLVLVLPLIHIYPCPGRTPTPPPSIRHAIPPPPGQPHPIIWDMGRPHTLTCTLPPRLSKQSARDLGRSLPNNIPQRLPNLARQAGLWPFLSPPWAHNCSIPDRPRLSPGPPLP